LVQTQHFKRHNKSSNRLHKKQSRPATNPGGASAPLQLKREFTSMPPLAAIYNNQWCLGETIRYCVQQSMGGSREYVSWQVIFFYFMGALIFLGASFL
jgi:hypothetical protein